MIGRACIVAGCGNMAVPPTSRCDRHAKGSSRPRACLICQRPTDGGDYCSPAHEEQHRLQKEPYRIAYQDPEYRRNRQARYVLAGGHCESCGVRLKGSLHESGMRWEADHDRELSQGGDNSVDNLRVRCIPCHNAKTRASRRERRG